QGMGWTEAEVRVDPGGAPLLVTRGRVQATLEALGVRSVGLSISHTGDIAMASVILLCTPGGKRPLRPVPGRRWAGPARPHRRFSTSFAVRPGADRTGACASSEAVMRW